MKLEKKLTDAEAMKQLNTLTLQQKLLKKIKRAQKKTIDLAYFTECFTKIY